MNLGDSILLYAGQLGAGMFPLPSSRDSLGDYVPDLSHIPRDPQRIIGQKQSDDPQVPVDGGDSAHKTGVTASCGSLADQ